MRFLRTRATQFAIDAGVIALALAVAYAIRFEGLPPRVYALIHAKCEIALTSLTVAVDKNGRTFPQTDFRWKPADAFP